MEHSGLSINHQSCDETLWEGEETNMMWFLFANLSCIPTGWGSSSLATLVYNYNNNSV